MYFAPSKTRMPQWQKKLCTIQNKITATAKKLLHTKELVSNIQIQFEQQPFNSTIRKLEVCTATLRLHFSVYGFSLIPPFVGSVMTGAVQLELHLQHHPLPRNCQHQLYLASISLKNDSYLNRLKQLMRSHHSCHHSNQHNHHCSRRCCRQYSSHSVMSVIGHKQYHANFLHCHS